MLSDPNLPRLTFHLLTSKDFGFVGKKPLHIYFPQPAKPVVILCKYCRQGHLFPNGFQWTLPNSNLLFLFISAFSFFSSTSVSFLAPARFCSAPSTLKGVAAVLFDTESSSPPRPPSPPLPPISFCMCAESDEDPGGEAGVAKWFGSFRSSDEERDDGIRATARLTCGRTGARPARAWLEGTSPFARACFLSSR